MSNPRDNIEAKLGLSGPPLQTVRDTPPAIPDHELIRRIGQGAYGEVWLARNALGTWRAVKIVYRDNFKDARPYEREFAGIRRFEPLSRSNEGFVDILQVGRDDPGGWFYYVMELADAANAECGIQSAESPLTRPSDTLAPAGGEGRGEGDAEIHKLTPHSALETPHSYAPRTLARDLHQRGRLPLEDCIQLGLTLTLALGHLHRHGLIHRDVKPSNIIFVGGVPKLADIGLVTEAQGANTFVGTEGFVPPEGPTSPQADLYALGKVIYEAAMGKDRNEFPEPFTQIGTDRESVALMELNAVLLRACAPDLKRRYATAEEMHADLALLHSGGSVKRRHQFDRQFQIAKQVGAVAIAATLLIGGAWLWQRQQTQKMTRLAEEKTTLATEKSKLADDLGKLDAENRNRIVRLDIANGIRLLDQGDPSGALLWFADALPLLTNNPAQESIHRIRIQQTLDQAPRVVRVFPHDFSVASGAFSPDGRFIATGTMDGAVRVWNASNGTLLWGPKRIGLSSYLRFSLDGKRLFVTSSTTQLFCDGEVGFRNLFVVLDAESGWRLLPPEESLFEVSTNLVFSCFSPDDRWLATVEGDNVIRVFDLNTGKRLTELPGHTDTVGFVSFSADGSLLASASRDRTVRIWRLPSGEPVGPPLRHRWPVAQARLTDRGLHLITASFARPGAGRRGETSESEVQAWEVGTGKPLGNPIPTGIGLAMFVAPEARGSFFVDGVKGADGVQGFSFEQPAKSVFSQRIGALHSWDFSNDGRWVAMGGGEYTARVFDARTGVPLTEPLRHGHWGINSVQFSPDGSQLLTTSSDGNARLWDLRFAPEESARRVFPARIRSSYTERLVAESKGTPILLDDGTVRVVDDSLQELHQFTLPERGAAIEFLTRARHLNLWSCRYGAGTNVPTSVLLWREDGEKIRQFTLDHAKPVLRDCFVFDDRHLITYAADRLVRFWSTTDGRLERTVEVPGPETGDLRNLCPDGRTAIWLQWASSEVSREISRQPSYSVRFLDLESGKVIGAPTELAAFGSAFSPDGKKLAIMDNLGPVTVIEARTGKRISSTIAHSSNLIWVQWDPEGRRLLTAGLDDQVLVWDVETGRQLIGPLRTQGGIVRVARWSPDGRFIVTRNDDKQVRVWDAMTGEAVTPPLKHVGDVAFAFMTRNHRIITASYPDLLRAWDLKESPLASDVLADYAKLLSGRRLSTTGALLTLKPEELAELNRSLLTRSPHLFE